MPKTNLMAMNKIVALFLLLGILIVLVTGAFMLIAFLPDILARSPYSYQVHSVYEFEPWSFATEEVACYFPNGGIITIINETGYKRSILLQGDCRIRVEGDLQPAEQAGGIFMVIEDSLFEQIRGPVIFNAAKSGELQSLAELEALKQVGIPVIWAGSAPVTFHKSEGLAYFCLLDKEGNPLPPPISNYDRWSVVGTFSLYLMLFLAVTITVAMLTLDYRPSRRWKEIYSRPPSGFELLYAFTIPALIYLLSPFQGSALFGLFPEPAYLVTIILLVILIRLKLTGFVDFGYRAAGLKKGYLPALMAGLLILLALKGFPVEIDIEATAMLRLLAVFAFAALPAEIVWRGFIQNTFSRKWGPTAGLLLMTAMTAGVSLLALFAGEPWLLSYPYSYLEPLLFGPGFAFVAGFIYIRTENIFAGALMNSLLFFLPTVLY